MKKKILAVLTCAVIALSLTACANNSNEDPVRSDKSGKESSTSSVVNEPTGSGNSDPANSDSGSSSGGSDSKTDDKNNSTDSSKPEEPSKPATVKVDWATVPVVDEIDLDYIVFESGEITNNNAAAYFKDEAKELQKDGGVIITKYFGEAEYINLPDTIKGKSLILIHNNVDWGENAKAIRFPESYSTAFTKPTVKNQGQYSCGLGHAANVTSIEIPDSWRYIGGFSGLPKLEEVKIPTETRRIWNEAFSGCKELKKVTIPENVEVINGKAFLNCSSLEQVTFPKKLANECIIASSAFAGCTSLKSVEIPEGVVLTYPDVINKEIHVYTDVFSGCTSLEKVSLPSTMKMIGKSTFSGCTSLKEVKMASGMETISYCAFSGCTSLSSVDIPDSVTKIEEGAFYNCTSLKIIDIPDSVTKIESAAFEGCTDISINYKGKTYNEKNIEKLYNKDLSAM